MKALALAVMVAIMPLFANAQYIISGTVTNENGEEGNADDMCAEEDGGSGTLESPAVAVCVDDGDNGVSINGLAVTIEPIELATSREEPIEGTVMARIMSPWKQSKEVKTVDKVAKFQENKGKKVSVECF